MIWNTYLPTLISPWFIALFVVLMIWDTAWKGVALWKSGRNNQMAWFICLLIFNTVGILPIIYLAFFQKKTAQRKRR